MIDTPSKALYPNEWPPATDYKPGDFITLLKASGYGNALGFDVLRRDLVTRYMYVEESQEIDVSTTTGDLVVRIKATHSPEYPLPLELLITGVIPEGRRMTISMDTASNKGVLVTVGGKAYQLAGGTSGADVLIDNGRGVLQFVSLGATWDSPSVMAEAVHSEKVETRNLAVTHGASIAGSIITLSGGRLECYCHLIMQPGAYIQPGQGTTGTQTISAGSTYTFPSGLYVGRFTSTAGGSNTRGIDMYDGASWVGFAGGTGSTGMASFVSNGNNMRAYATGQAFTFRYRRM